MYEGCSNMNASSFITFFTYMLRQNVIHFWKELFVAFKKPPNTKKHSLYFSSYRRLYKDHTFILTFFWSKLPYMFWYMCGYSVISLLVWDRIAPNFRCMFKVHRHSCLREKVYIILFQSRVNRHVCDVINFIINVILSNLLVMQLLTSLCLFLCILFKICLICHKEVFKTLRPLFTELSHFISFCQAFSAS